MLGEAGYFTSLQETALSVVSGMIQVVKGIELAAEVLETKKKAGPNEIVTTHADFQIQMRDCWRVLATRRRNAFFFIVGLSGLSVLELVMILRKSRGGA